VVRQSIEREIVMSKFFQNTRTAIVLSGSAALIALMTAAPVAQAQGVPAGLLRLDPPASVSESALAAHAQVRSTHVRSRKVETDKEAH
jgi:hypothetical protein